MDNCEAFKSLILTDYIDGEIGQAERGRLEGHLVSCPSCRVFAEEVKQQLVTPFKAMPREIVSDRVWASIKETIEQQEPVGYSFLDKINAWIESLSLPRFAPALLSFVMLIFIASGVAFNQQIKQARDIEQVEYLAYLIDEPSGSLGVGDEGLATPIETYFL